MLNLDLKKFKRSQNFKASIYLKLKLDQFVQFLSNGFWCLRAAKSWTDLFQFLFPNVGESFWTLWEPWSSCSATCGNGQKRRKRFCIHGSHEDHARCDGQAMEKIKCNNRHCDNSDSDDDDDNDDDDDDDGSGVGTSGDGDDDGD